MIAGALSEPSSDLGMLVGGIVVGDEMDVERFGDVGIDVAEEGKELLGTMALFALGQDVPVAMSRAANRVVVPWRT